MKEKPGLTSRVKIIIGALQEERKFELLPALAYLANMRTFWMLILGLGEFSLPAA